MAKTGSRAECCRYTLYSLAGAANLIAVLVHYHNYYHYHYNYHHLIIMVFFVVVFGFRFRFGFKFEFELESEFECGSDCAFKLLESQTHNTQTETETWLLNSGSLIEVSTTDRATSGLLDCYLLAGSIFPCLCSTRHRLTLVGSFRL